MKICDYLFKEAQPIWKGYLTHPFIKELGEGTLPKEKFKKYLIQDYLYLKQYSKVFCMGIVKANDLRDMKFFYESTKGIMEGETQVHIRYLKHFGYDLSKVEKMESNIVNLSYTSYMKSKGLTGNIKEIGISTLPCTWSYNYIGKYIYKKYKNNLENNFYKDWIEEYALKDFSDFTSAWIDYINDLCKDVSQSEKEKLKDIFINSSKYERYFWDIAYNSTK